MSSEFHKKVILRISSKQREQTIKELDNLCKLYFTKYLPVERKAYKIIGEISPDALSYVKEGDEFSEGEWRLFNAYTGINRYENNVEGVDYI